MSICGGVLLLSHHKPKLQVNIQTGKWHCWVSNQGGHNLFQLLKKVNLRVDKISITK